MARFIKMKIHFDRVLGLGDKIQIEILKLLLQFLGMIMITINCKHASKKPIPIQYSI